MDEVIDTYEPEIVKQTELDVNPDSSDFQDIMDGKLIHTRLNDKVIIQRIAKDLYKSAHSGTRELYANAVRACKRAEEAGQIKQGEIRIEMNEDTRRLTIQDNGIGISIERFKQVLLELGTSDNHDAEMAGQFGMGFASYTTLSSSLVLSTRTTAGDDYRMIARDGMSFQHVGKSGLDHVGTRLEMICYSKTSMHNLWVRLKEVISFSGVRTTMIFGEQTDIFEPKTFVEDAAQNYSEHELVHLEDEDLEFLAVLGRLTTDRATPERRVYLANVPIHIRPEFPFECYYLNIKNERKYKPMPSRDELTLEACERLETKLEAMIKNYMGDIEINNYKDFQASERKQSFLWLATHMEYSERHHDILTAIRETKARRLYNDTNSFWMSLGTILGTYPDVVLIQTANPTTVKRLTALTDKAILQIKSRQKEKEVPISMLTAFGFPTSKDIKGRADIKDYVVHEHLPGHTYVQHHLGKQDVNADTIVCNSISIQKLRPLLNNIPSNYTFCKNYEDLDDNPKYSDWLMTLGEMKTKTNKGEKTVLELLDDPDAIFLTDHRPEYDNIIQSMDKTVCYGNDNQAMAVAVLTLALRRTVRKVNMMNMAMLITEVYRVCLSQSHIDWLVEKAPLYSVYYRELLANLIVQTFRRNEWDERQVEDVMKNECHIKYDTLDTLKQMIQWQNRYDALVNTASDSGNINVVTAYKRMIKKAYYEVRTDKDGMQKLVREFFIPHLYGAYADLDLKFNPNGFIAEFSPKRKTVTSCWRSESFPAGWQVVSTQFNFETKRIRLEVVT